jgi:hypothetical protein
MEKSAPREIPGEDVPGAPRRTSAAPARPVLAFPPEPMQSGRHLTSSLVTLFGSLALATLPALGALAGCGGSNGPGSFFNIGPDAAFVSGDAADLTQDAGSLLVDANLPPCPPAPVTSFAPVWKPPVASKSGACTSGQISSYFDACLSPSSNPAGCSTYTQANTTCVSCLESDETAAQYGPVIWHSNRLYYTTNIAGCIADMQADGGADGCGAAYQGVVECKQAACSACMTPQTPVFSRYLTCENQAGTECESYIKTLTGTCGATLKDPSNPIAVCIPPQGDTPQDAYLRLAPMFCGK